MILAQFDKILQNVTCFYGILGPFLCANCQFKNLSAQKNLFLECLVCVCLLVNCKNILLAKVKKGQWSEILRFQLKNGQKL